MFRTRELLLLSPLVFAVVLFASMFEAVIAATPPVNITSFQELDPPSVTGVHFGWSIDASDGKVLVGGFDDYAFIYDVATGHELRRLRGSDTQHNDLFGRAVAISEQYALVGANQAQAAYVFDVQTGAQLRKFSDPNAPPTFGFGFGIAVAVDGNIALVGDPSDDAKGSDAGAAYMYNITSGQLVRTFSPAEPFSIGHGFGADVDVEGNTIVIGAPGAPGSFNSSSGAAYVYDVATGTRLRTLTPESGQISRNFGGTVEIAGNLVMIGDSDLSGAGAAYLFDLETGQQLRKFVSPNPNNAGEFGDSIAFDGRRALIGSWTEQIGDQYFVGSAYLYDALSGQLLATLLPQELKSFDDSFGYSVAMSGNTLIASALSDSGHVYLATIPEPDAIVLGAWLLLCAAPLARPRRRPVALPCT
jgi:outer membrane protein assembly factor BamB